MEEKNITETAEPEVEELTPIEKLNKMRKAFRNADVLWKVITSVVVLMTFVYIYFAYNIVYLLIPSS